MLQLYHGATSVCSVKARIGLAEKQLDWESKLLELPKGEHKTPEYLALNPEAVVPTLVHNGFVVRESSVILDYVDQISDFNPLMPVNNKARTLTRLWLLRTLEIHAAINSLTFATVIRDNETKRRTPEEMEAWIATVPNPQIRAKRRDLMANGPQSAFVDGAIHTLNGMFRDMTKALADTPWLAGENYSLSDTALVAYVDRLDRLSMAGLWDGRFKGVSGWLARSRERPSYAAALDGYTSPQADEASRAAGARAWPAIAKRLA